MEGNTENRNGLDTFFTALTCSPPVYFWRYSPDGELLETNAPIHLYHRIFEHTGCLDYMLNEGAKEKTPVILGASLGILWCAVYEWKDDVLDSCYVLGPVFYNEVDPDTLSKAVLRYPVDPDWKETFISAMRAIPAASCILFFQYAVMLHFYITGEMISRSDLRFQHKDLLSRKGKGSSLQNNHHVYQTEQSMMRNIRDGNLNYKVSLEKASVFSSGIGISTHDPLHRAVLSSVAFTTLCCRAAIEGGLTPDTAYSVCDSYMQTAIECKTVGDVQNVNHAMYDDFVRRVYRQRQNPRYSPQIRSCTAFIETHLNEDLSLERLSHEVGYTEYHLSRKFKAETGRNIRDYIRSVRIEHAKHLLSKTDMSIHDIAESLRFSSQSHFAHVFLEMTGQLPQQYRKEHYQ